MHIRNTTWAKAYAILPVGINAIPFRLTREGWLGHKGPINSRPFDPCTCLWFAATLPSILRLIKRVSASLHQRRSAAVIHFQTSDPQRPLCHLVEY